MSTPASVRPLSAVFFITGLGVGVWGWGDYRTTSASRSWPSVPGEVVQSEVDRLPGKADSKGRFSYRPLVRYTYMVDGRTYESDRYSFRSRTARGRTGPPSTVRRIVTDNPVGAPVEVFYDPASPEDAVLVPEVDGLPLGLAILGFFACAIGGYNFVRPESGIVPAFVDFGRGAVTLAFRAGRR